MYSAGLRVSRLARRARGVEPDWRTAGAQWKRERDIPDDVYFQALEAAG